MLNALEPGTMMPIHRHRKSSETVVIVRGSLIERFYDDEGNNYNYEKGAYATTKFHWDDKAQTLTIGKREGGEFPGMLKSRKFRVVLVKKNFGVGLEKTTADVKNVDYRGEAVSVRLN